MHFLTYWSSELQHQALVWYTGTNTLQEGTVLFQILGLLQTSRSTNYARIMLLLSFEVGVSTVEPC
jgi:hypothetical protein